MRNTCQYDLTIVGNPAAATTVHRLGARTLIRFSHNGDTVDIWLPTLTAQTLARQLLATAGTGFDWSNLREEVDAIKEAKVEAKKKAKAKKK